MTKSYRTNENTVLTAEKPKKSRAKMFIAAGILTAGLAARMLTGCSEDKILPVDLSSKPPDVIVKVYMSDNKQDGGVAKDAGAATDAGVQDAGVQDAGVQAPKYCGDPKVIDFGTTTNSGKLEMAKFVMLENNVIATIVDLTADGKAMLDVWYEDYSKPWQENRAKKQTIQVSAGEQVETINPSGEKQVLEFCAVNNGYTLAEKSVNVASDKKLKFFDGSETSILSICEIPDDAVKLSAMSTAYINSSIQLGDGNKIVVQDIVFPGETIGNDLPKVLVSFVDANGKEIATGALSTNDTCYRTISAGGKEYHVRVYEIGGGQPKNWRYTKIGVISGVDTCWLSSNMEIDAPTEYTMEDGNVQKLVNTWSDVKDESVDGKSCADKKLLKQHDCSFNEPIPLGAYKDRKIVKYLDHDLILSRSDENSVELVTEAAYSPMLSIGESLDIGDGTGNRLVIGDLVTATDKRAAAAVIAIKNLAGEEIASGTVDMEEGTIKVGYYLIRVYDVASGYTLAEKWASIGIINNLVTMRTGERKDLGNSSGWDRYANFKVKTSNGALDGWVIDVENVWVGGTTNY